MIMSWRFSIFREIQMYMKNVFSIILMASIMMSCNKEEKVFKARTFEYVDIETIFEDSTASIRAIDFDEDYLYYGSLNHIGKRALNKELKFSLDELKLSNGKNHFKNILNFEDKPLAFRAIENVNGDLLALSISAPARLYKLSRKSQNPILVYEEDHEKAFYDSMGFWNDEEGVAIGDPTDGCMSVIITRDGGNSWVKLSCDDLPKAKEGEAAFAASDSNIAIVGDNTWVATGGKASRVMYSPDKGKTWKVYETPVVQGLETTGMYSIDFYDDKNGFAIGGDYTKAADSSANKIRTSDGGKTWKLVAQNQSPGYRSCVQYVPNSNAKQLVAIGFKGIDYSNDAGDSWTHLSDEGFYTIRFLNDSVAYAAGNKRIAKLTFRK
jgi:photosystem II stability/assembly factor-like uncharacterized protein